MFETLAEKMIFYPERTFMLTPEMLHLEYEDVFLSTEDSRKIHGWYFPGSKNHSVLFFHGNAGNIADRLDNVRLLVECGLSVFIIDYRGYGRSEGKPTEQGTYRDATAAWTWLQERNAEKQTPITIFGRSLGGAVAIELATRVQPDRVILESTFTSVRDLGSTFFPFLPAILIPALYPNIDRIQNVQCPLMIVHGTRDSLVPFSHGKRLFERAVSDKSFYPIEGADHNDTYLVGGRDYFRAITDFIFSDRER